MSYFRCSQSCDHDIACLPDVCYLSTLSYHTFDVRSHVITILLVCQMCAISLYTFLSYFRCSQSCDHDIACLPDVCYLSTLSCHTSDVRSHVITILLACLPDVCYLHTLSFHTFDVRNHVITTFLVCQMCAISLNFHVILSMFAVM